ncbi:hypothetical protein IUJ58_18260 [Priestia aryabhattai]|uniref:hypothetical protein n=1 Tax=Priestia aryabhattai TaxID=412384 RepID=UPI0023793E47|nr:hypothetical protein [Priestia aryabhattai]WDL85898.1 hypothetical protein IUJ58_18260 [Priestia aryabhattai]
MNIISFRLFAEWQRDAIQQIKRREAIKLLVFLFVKINCFQIGNCMVRFDTLKTALIFVKVENRIKNL